MLCPKCGFISFDHLSHCVKCQNDLSGIGAVLHGTTADVASRFFLGTLVKDGSALQGPAEKDARVVAEEASSGQEEIGGDEEEAFVLGEEGVAREGAGETSPVDESPALEFDLDELSHLDSSDSGTAVGPETLREVSAQPEEEEQVTLLDIEGLNIDTEKKGEDAVVSPAVAGGGGSGEAILEEIDTSSLTLESMGEIGSPATVSPDEENQSGRLTVDLNEIDLSDLVHRPKEAPADLKNVGDTGVGGLDLDDTMDLSLFEGESRESQLDGGSSSADNDGLKPINLTLMDDALAELSVDPGRKEQDRQAKVKSDIVSLSMEDSNG